MSAEEVHIYLTLSFISVALLHEINSRVRRTSWEPENMHRAELGKTLTSECIALIRKGFNKGPSRT